MNIKGGRHLVDIKGDISWTKGVTFRGHFWVTFRGHFWVTSRGHFLGDISWTFLVTSRGHFCPRKVT